MGLRTTREQQRTVDLLEKLGSNVGQGIQSGSSVRVPVPFHATPHNNVEVFVDGSWHDYSANKDWETLGLASFGDLEDLEEAVGERFNRVWRGLYPVTSPAAKEYCEKRMLDTSFLKESTVNGHIVICFPMGVGDIVGIQRRFIVEHEPKNMEYHGSDAKHGLFYHPNFSVPANRTVYVCEGATDTFTNFLPSDGWAIGAISCSNLDGVLDYIKTVDHTVHVVLCLDADEPGQEAQNKIYWAIKDRFDSISEMKHSEGCKDLNDEWTKHGKIDVREIEKGSGAGIFVKMVDELPQEADAYHNAQFNFVGFFPPDFPGFYHTMYPDPKSVAYIFPESYGRSEVNKLMWKLRKSAYILRGW